MVKQKRSKREHCRSAAQKHGVSGADVYSVRAYLRALCEVLDALNVENFFPPSTLPRPERRQRRD